jgi:hypothetical protein
LNIRNQWIVVCLLTELVSSQAIARQTATVRITPVTKEVVEELLKRYGGDDSRREAAIKQMFGEAGCDDQHLSEQPVNGWPLPNIICALPGSTERTIIVGAHFDHAPKGDGVVDNGSGASLLPSIYQSLQGEERKHTYVFVAFSEEERGEIGSKFYVRQMTDAQVALTDAMVNLDTLGLAPAAYWPSYADRQLIAELVYFAGEVKLPISAVDIEEVRSTDSMQFGVRGIPSITIRSLTQKTWDAGILHTRKDVLSAIRLDDDYETYHLVGGYLAYLANFTSSRDRRPKPPPHLGRKNGEGR